MMTLLVILLLLILIMITPPVGIIVLIGMELWYFPEVFIPLLVVGLIITVFVWMFHTSGMSAKQEAEENETIRRESEEVSYQQYAENRREHPEVPLQDWGIIWGEKDVEAYEVRFQREQTSLQSTTKPAPVQLDS